VQVILPYENIEEVRFFVPSHAWRIFVNLLVEWV
jgi:hypothetical protein